MNSRKLFYLFLFIVHSASGQNRNKLDSLFSALENSHRFNGNVLIGKKDRTIYHRSVGNAQMDPPKKMRGNSAFQIGSISKTFTAVAVLQLVKQHKLSLEDNLSKYFPEIPYQNISIYHLLGHTSGLPDKEELFFPLIDANADYIATNDSIITVLKKAKKALAFEPGSQWRYNNIGFCLLANLVEKVSGEPFGSYLRNHIFIPTGMKNSYLLGQEQQDSSLVHGYLIRHHYLGDLEDITYSKKVIRWTYNLRKLYGPTNIVSTAEDLFRFINALGKYKLLDRDLLKQAFSPVRLNDGSVVVADGEFGSASYGLGWFVPSAIPFGNMVMHTGREPGFFSFFWYDVTNQKSIILLDNAESTGFGSACKETFNIVYGTNYFKPESAAKKSLFLIYVKTLLKAGSNAGAALYNQLKTNTVEYFTDERELNELGLELLEDGHMEEALEALKLATLIYPDSWNTYDSYAKALLENGMINEAIQMYTKSVTMFPGNLPAKDILKRLHAEK